MAGGMEPKEYMFMATIGLVLLTNTPVLYVLYRDRSLRSIKYLWIIGLCIGDFSTGALALPLSFIVRAQIPALGGRLFPLCLFFTCMGGITRQVNTLGLLFVTLDRFVAIRFPFFYHRRMSPRKVVLLIILMWLIALLTSHLPLLGWNKGWPEDVACTIRTVYNEVFTYAYDFYVRFLFLQIGIMIAIIAMYVYIFSVIRKHSRQIRNQEQVAGSSGEKTKQEKQVKQEFQAARCFALYSLAYIGCLFPHLVISISENFTDFWKTHLSLVENIAIVLSYWVSVINPILYLYSNQSLKISFVKVFPILKPVIRVREDEEATCRATVLHTTAQTTTKTCVVKPTEATTSAPADKEPACD